MVKMEDSLEKQASYGQKAKILSKLLKNKRIHYQPLVNLCSRDGITRLPQKEVENYLIL